MIVKRTFLYAMLFSLTAACGSDEAFDGGGGGPGGTPECFSSNECPAGFTCNEFGSCEAPGSGQDAGVPPEVEIEFSEPTHSDRYVYVAMSELDALARIDGATLEVSSIGVGDQPEIVATIPLSDGAIVLDQNNGTATIVRPAADGSNDVRIVPTLSNMNRLSVSPSGGFALVWFDLNQAAQDGGGLGGVGEIGSFQDVTVIRLEEGNEHAVDLTVGFRPRAIEFSADGSRAFVITEDGISVIELAEVVEQGPHIVAPIALGGDGSVAATDQEVHIVSSGKFAMVRELGKNELRVVQLLGVGIGGVSSIALPASPTDLDLSNDGLTAYAVLRDTAQLAVLPLSSELPTSEDVQLVSFAGAEIGSMVIAPDDTQAILFTNASSVEAFTLVQLGDPLFASRSQRLQKSVRALGFDPTGTSVLVTHAKAAGNPLEDGISFEEFIDRSFGYSIVDLQTGFAKLQVTSVDPGAFVFSTESPRAYVLLNAGVDQSITHVLNLETGIVKEQIMSSPPQSLGVLPQAESVFINQEHPLGRVSFIHLQTDAMRTLTGFDLNSRVVD